MLYTIQLCKNQISTKNARSKMQKRLWSRTQLTQLIIALSLLAIASVIGLSWQQTSTQQHQEIKQAEEEIIQLTNFVADNTQLMFLSVDLTLRRAVERQYFNALFGGNLKSDMQHNLVLWAKETPPINALMLTDENATIHMLARKKSSTFKFPGNRKFPYNSHFTFHRDNENLNIKLSVAKSNVHPSKDILIMSRRLEKLDGSFGGLVIALIDETYLNNFVSSVDVGKYSDIAFVLDKTTLILASESTKKNQTTLLSALNRTDLQQSKAMKEYVNNSLNIYAFNHIENLPITVVGSISEHGIFNNWYQSKKNTLIYVGILLAFILIILICSLLILKQMRHSQESERKAMLASQAKSDFLAKMSHELRTPLNAIIGFSDMLSSEHFGSINPNQKERLRDVNMCGNHLLELINDILDFSKAQAGKINLHEETFNIDNTIRNTIRMIDQKAKTRSIEIINATGNSLPVLQADKRKIRQIIINLLSNAIKFTPKGGKIIVTSEFDKNHNFVLSIRDTGIGMEEKDIPKAMTVFEQVHHNPKFEGTGLGLPLCKMFTELHGGYFVLQSKLGVGTKASIILPKRRVISKANNILDIAA